jgi:O-antigen/teichoic acid export membrane protein
MTTSKAHIHLVANFAGRGWTALLALLVTPYYLNVLGVESYGLIGLYSSVCAFFSVVDFGLGEAFCRETARFFAKETTLPHPSVRTMEMLYWLLGAIFSLSMILGAPWISQKWLLNQSHFCREKICMMFRLMAISFFILWPQIFYAKGLQGLQAHLLNNSLLIFGASLRYLGSIGILAIKPTLEAFFWWQILSAFIQTTLMAVSTWNKLCMHRIQLSFSGKMFSNFWKFTLGMSAIGATSVILQQMDKFLVSHFFSLEKLGYYCFAYTIASSLYYLVQPIVTFYYPIFIQCIETKNFVALKSAYNTSYKLVLMIIAPCVLLLTFFGKQIIEIWISNAHAADMCAPLVTLLAWGILLNCFASISFYIQFALGYTRAILYQNVFSFLLLIPTSLLLVHFFGLLGVAVIYIVLNLGYIMLNIPLVRHKILSIHG